MSSGLRRDLERLQIALDGLPARAIVRDARGDAWQRDSLGHWYQAFRADSESSFGAAQIMTGPIVVLHPGGTS